VRQAPAPAHERELLELLLAEPRLVAEARREITVSGISHSGVRELVEGLYRLEAEGVEPTLDQLRTRLDKPRLIDKAFELLERGRAVVDRQGWWQGLRAWFRKQQVQAQIQDTQNRLQAANDTLASGQLLNRLQDLQRQLQDIAQQSQNRTSG
jgi:hypothetical protein